MALRKSVVNPRNSVVNQLKLLRHRSYHGLALSHRGGVNGLLDLRYRWATNPGHFGSRTGRISSCQWAFSRSFCWPLQINVIQDIWKTKTNKSIRMLGSGDWTRWLNTIESLNIRDTRSQNWMFIVSSCSCPCPTHWSQMLSWEWRCSWRIACQCCSDYIWVINKFIAH